MPCWYPGASERSVRGSSRAMSYATTTTLREGRPERNRITCSLPARSPAVVCSLRVELAVGGQHDHLDRLEVGAGSPARDHDVGADLRVGALARREGVHLLDVRGLHVRGLALL